MLDLGYFPAPFLGCFGSLSRRGLGCILASRVVSAVPASTDCIHEQTRSSGGEAGELQMGQSQLGSLAARWHCSHASRSKHSTCEQPAARTGVPIRSRVRGQLSESWTCETERGRVTTQGHD